MKKLLSLLGISLLVTPAFSENGNPSFKEAFQQDASWPHTVAPIETIHDAEGNKLLDAKIPVVLIRAYPDGQLLIVDREGTFLVEHSKTDFSSRLAANISKSNQTGGKLMLNQLGRRVIDLSHDKTKAVSERELENFDQFIVIRTPVQKSALGTLVAELDKNATMLAERKIRPVLIFKERLSNREFYDLISEMNLPYPVVAPLFQKGVGEALFSEREKYEDLLLVNLHGKLLESYDSIEILLKDLK